MVDGGNHLDPKHIVTLRVKVGWCTSSSNVRMTPDCLTSLPSRASCVRWRDAALDKNGSKGRWCTCKAVAFSGIEQDSAVYDARL